MNEKNNNMTLIGKCKTDFENWWGENHYMDFCDDKVYLGLDNFYKQSFSMQYGVLVDFFDSVGIIIEIQVHVSPNMQGGDFNGFKAVLLSKGRFVNTFFKSSKREVTRTKAIEKANEIYNKNTA